jgi:hypothetical protein
MAFDGFLDLRPIPALIVKGPTAMLNFSEMA